MVPLLLYIGMVSIWLQPHGRMVYPLSHNAPYILPTRSVTIFGPPRWARISTTRIQVSLHFLFFLFCFFFFCWVFLILVECRVYCVGSCCKFYLASARQFYTITFGFHYEIFMLTNGNTKGEYVRNIFTLWKGKYLFIFFTNLPIVCRVDKCFH